MSANSRPVPRRHHKKSFTGCQNCKDRKVKCDETHPLCKNCAKHFINMDRCFFDPVIESEGSIGDVINATPEAALNEIDTTYGSRKRGVKGKFSQNRAAYEREGGDGSSKKSRTVNTTSIAAFFSSRGRHKCLSKWHEPASLPMVIGAGQMDPFNSHPATKAPDVDVLLSHYLSTFVLRNFLYFTTCPMVKLWWPFIQSDSLLFHVALLLSSLSLEEAKDSKEGNKARQLFGGRNSRQIQAECIRQLSDRVQDQVLGTSDQTIVAVANLAALEHERGNIKMVQMHMDGLKRMVTMRGGLNSIRSTSPLAANIAFWMSMVAMHETQLLPAEFVGYEEPIVDALEDSSLFQFGLFTPEGSPHGFSDIVLPYYNPEKLDVRSQTVQPHDTYLSFIDPADLTEQPQVSTCLHPNIEHINSSLLPACTTSCNISTDVHIDFTTYGVPPSHAQILHSIQHLSQRFATIVDYNSNTSSETTISVFSELCFLLQRLLRLPAADAISDSCRFAAAIQLISPLWGYYPDCTLVINTLLHRLTVSLKSILLFPSDSAPSIAIHSPFPVPFAPLNASSATVSIGANINYLLLWLFFVGAAEADKRTPEHDWFVGHLVVIVNEVGIEAWEGPLGIRSVLVRFVWHDTFCEGPLREVWDEVRERREVLMVLEREPV